MYVSYFIMYILLEKAGHIVNMILDCTPVKWHIAVYCQTVNRRMQTCLCSQNDAFSVSHFVCAQRLNG